MKICIMMCGLKRSYDVTQASLHKNLIDCLTEQGAHVDIFTHSDQFLNVKYLRGYTVNPHLMPEGSPSHMNRWKVTKTKQGWDVFTVQMLRLFECFNKLVLPFSIKHKRNYDFIICIRPDYYYFENCLEPISKWSKDRLSVRIRGYPIDLPLKYHTGIVDKGESIVDDQFFIIPGKLAQLALAGVYGNHHVLCNSTLIEAKLTRLWESNNLKFNLLAFNGMIYNWKADKDGIVLKARTRMCNLNLINK
jgi:hypothetical protein